MIDENVELSSDLEWMLQSRQASPAMLAEALVNEFYPSVYRLALALLEDREAARAAALKTLSSALANASSYGKASGLLPWFYRLALVSVQAAQTRMTGGPGARAFAGQEGGSSNPAESALRRCLLALDEGERTAALLYYLPGLSTEEVAQAMKRRRSEVEATLQGARRAVSSAPGWEGLSSGELDARLRGYFQSWWPSPELYPEDLRAVISTVLGQADAQRRRQRRLISFSEIIWIGAAVLLALGLAWTSGRSMPQPEATPYPLNTPVPSPTPTQELVVSYFAQPGETLASIAAHTGVHLDELVRLNPNFIEEHVQRGQWVKLPAESPSSAPTPVPPAASQLEPLDSQASSETILHYLAASPAHWHTLWADVQVIRYGPPGYVGPPQAYRSQVWISQPGQSIQLIGPVAGDPTYRFLTSGKFIYFSSRDSQYSWYSDSTGLLVSWSALPDLIFPYDSNWLKGPGSFKIVGDDKQAGRAVVVADWIDQRGKRERRLWMDTLTGVILRQREFGGSDDQTVLADYVVSEVAFDADFPAGLFNPRQPNLAYAQDYRGQPVLSRAPQPAATWVPPQGHAPLPMVRLPSVFDPAHSRLTFQYPGASGGQDVQPAKSPIINLFADEFFLGKVQFAGPWNLECSRSPDGRRLAFTSKGSYPQPGDPASSKLSWFNLSDLSVHHPQSEIIASNFAFGPDSRRLAVFGYVHNYGMSTVATKGGIEILDTDTGEEHWLLDLGSADSLVWNPDGERLALIGTDQSSHGQEVMIVSASTGEIDYRAPYDPAIYRLPQDGQRLAPGFPSADWPALGWGVSFPVEPGGLEACSAPPGSGG